MLVRVYAIVGRPLSRRALSGIGRGIRLVTDGPTSAIVADCGAPATPTARALRAHDAVVRRIARVAPAVLPARFGSEIESDVALQAFLRADEARLQAALRLVHKHEQMTLRLFGPPAPDERHERSVRSDLPGSRASGVTEAEGAGTRYLTRRGVARLAPELERLRLLLAPVVVAERITRHDRGPLLLTAHHLGPRGAAAAYRRIVRRHAASSGCRLAASGPWPPYAFGPERTK
jgi:hypothetical protein